MNDNRIEIETPLGKLVAYKSIDPDYPGIYIDLERNGIGMSVCLVEVNNSEDEDKDTLVSRIWSDGREEDYTCCIAHEGIEDFFGQIG
jgi:hypothetical protein